jgi:hypothetical protein
MVVFICMWLVGFFFFFFGVNRPRSKTDERRTKEIQSVARESNVVMRGRKEKEAEKLDRASQLENKNKETN